MKQSVLWCMCGVTLLLSAAPGIEARDAPNWVTLDAKGNVRSFYGVPVSLTRSGLKRLGFKTSREYGDYKLMARDKVEIYVTFDRRGNFYRATTMSKNAVGPRGIRVGSRRSEVTAAFPKGRFGYGCEDGFNAVSTTGTNVLFDYDTKDMPPRALQCEQLPDSEVPDLKVKAIRIESMAID